MSDQESSLVFDCLCVKMAAFLPITRRGKFFKDDYFKDYQSDFDSAVNKVMDRFSGRSMLADQFSNYRKMKKDSGDTGAAASISDTKDNYVIVLDMSDFIDGSITVSTSGRNAIVEATSGGKKFSKRYPLPQIINTDGIKSAMSDEGILTITAAKHIAKNIPLTSDEGPDSEPAGSSSQPEDTPLKLDIDDSAFGRRGSSQFTHQESVTRAPETRRVSIDRRGKFFQDPKFENVWSDFEVAMDQMVDKERRKKSRDEKRSERDAILNRFNQRFFNDEPSAAKVTDELFDSSRSGRLHTYRNLRQWDPEDATQALKVNSSEKGYKIVMDAKDIDSNSLSVKASGEGLVVSGGEGASAFKRRFSLPGLVDVEVVNATVSEDGILTISVPFK